MIYLYEIANDDFLLLSTAQDATACVAGLDRLGPGRIIVAAPVEDGRPTFWLLAPEELRAWAKAVQGTLGEVLSQVPQTPALDAYADAEQTPERCVVLKEGELAGYFDARVPPAPRIRRGTDEGLLQRTYSLDAEHQEVVALGQTLAVTVRLVRGIPGLKVLSATLGSEIDVVVRARRGFVVVGSDQGSLLVTEKGSEPFLFKLLPTQPGPGQIVLYCFYQGRSLGHLTLEPLVVASPPRQAEPVQISLPLAPMTGTPPDLVLYVFEDRSRQAVTFHLRASARDPAHKLNMMSFGPIELRVPPKEFFRQFFSEIERLPLKTSEQRQSALLHLRQKGVFLFHHLVPPPLAERLFALRGRISQVQIQSDDPYIPWEMMRLCGREGGQVVEGPFVCEAFEMTRWIPGVPRRLHLPLGHLAVMIPGDAALPGAVQEQKMLLSLATEGMRVTLVPATFLDVHAALAGGTYDGFHFCGHGHADPNLADSGALWLQDREPLRPHEISGVMWNCARRQPLFFLNACQSGQQGLSLTGVGGFARHLLVNCEASVFIGAQWAVSDMGACRFATAFYRHVLAKKTVAQAVQAARAAIWDTDPLDALAYTVYADTDVRITRAEKEG